MTARICASNSPECTGMLPCEACFEVVRERVLVPALGYASYAGACDPNFAMELYRPGGAFAHAFSDHGEALKAQYAAHIANMREIEARQAAQAQAYSEPPAVQADAQVVQAAAAPKPCPAVLHGGGGGVYPCTKEFGHVLRGGRGDELHVNGEQEWRDDPTDEQLRRAIEHQQDLVAAAAQQADEAVRGPMPTEEQAKEYLRSVGYVDDGTGQLRPRRPHDPPPPPEQTTSTADPAAVESPTLGRGEQAPGTDTQNGASEQVSGA